MHPLILIFFVIGGVIVFPVIRYLLTEHHDSDIHAYLLSKGGDGHQRLVLVYAQ